MELEEFVEHVSGWHERQVSQLEIIRDAKPDTTLKIEGSSSFELDANQAKWFRHGVGFALELLGRLPFSVHEDKSDDTDEHLEEILP